MSDRDDSQILEMEDLVREADASAPAPKKTARKAARKTTRKTAKKAAAEEASETTAASSASASVDVDAPAKPARKRAARKTAAKKTATKAEAQETDAPVSNAAGKEASAPSEKPAGEAKIRVPAVSVPQLDEEVPQHYSSDDDDGGSNDDRRPEIDGDEDSEARSRHSRASERRRERREARLAQAPSLKDPEYDPNDDPAAEDFSDDSSDDRGEESDDRNSSGDRGNSRDRGGYRERNQRQRNQSRYDDNSSDDDSDDSDDRSDDSADSNDSGRQNRDRRGRDRDSGQRYEGRRHDNRDSNRGGNGQSNSQGQNYNDRKLNKKQKQKQKKKQRQGGNQGPGGGNQGNQKRVRADFFGSEDGVSIEVGNLPDADLLRDLDALEAIAAEQTAEGAVNLNELFTMNLNLLATQAKEQFDVKIDGAPIRQQVIEQIMESAFASKRPIRVEGVMETTQDGFGLLTYQYDSYRIRPLCAFVSKQVMKRYGLKRGHVVQALLHPPRQELTDDGDKETSPFVIRVETIMGRDPQENLNVTPFEDLVPYYPTERLLLETSPDAKWDNVSMRVVDLLTPVGKGQRGLIVAPPRTGKTILQQGIANAIMKNNPEAHLIILLVDERPEEVTDFRRQINKGEVIASTFDETAESHVHAAEMVIEKARRMVEVGKDVIILLDSITRLARAYNALASNSGKILSGGVEATALQKPKRFFGSARNIEGGGSLTIMGTALVETGSRMDEVIFEEFKGTGNQELHLDRALVDKRIFPAINLEKSGTRKEELLYHPDELVKVYGLRRAMKGVPSPEAMEMLITRVKKTKTNVEFLMALNR